MSKRDYSERKSIPSSRFMQETTSDCLKKIDPASFSDFPWRGIFAS